MRFSDTLIATYKGGQRHALWCRKRRIPSGAVFHRAYFLAAPVHIFSGCLVADELLASDRVLSFGEPLEMFLARWEEHTSELQSHLNLVCRLLLEKKKTKRITRTETSILSHFTRRQHE